MPDYESVARWEWRGSGSERSTQMPQSPLHAAEPGASKTLCGESTEQMMVTGAWRPGGWGGRCHECKAIAENPADD